MIKTEIYEQALFETIKRGATEISADVREAFESAIARESNADAKKGLVATLQSMKRSETTASLRAALSSLKMPQEERLRERPSLDILEQQ